MTREMFSELLQRNKELEEQFIRATDSAMQLLEIDKEHQRINGELREENKRLNNIINKVILAIEDIRETNDYYNDYKVDNSILSYWIDLLKDSDKE